MTGLGALFASEAPRELTDELVRPGWLGFSLFLALVVACFFLFRSMNRQLKKIDFDEDAPADPGGAVEGEETPDPSPRPEAPSPIPDDPAAP